MHRKMGPATVEPVPLLCTEHLSSASRLMAGSDVVRAACAVVGITNYLDLGMQVRLAAAAAERVCA